MVKFLVYVPRIFAQDRIDRDLPMPRDGKFVGSRFVGYFDDDQLNDLLSDARHYACGGIEPSEAPQVVASARRFWDSYQRLA